MTRESPCNLHTATNIYLRDKLTQKLADLQENGPYPSVYSDESFARVRTECFLKLLVEFDKMPIDTQTWIRVVANAISENRINEERLYEDLCIVTGRFFDTKTRQNMESQNQAVQKGAMQ